MMPTRGSALLALFVGAAAVVWGGVRVAEGRGVVLPPLPVTAALPMAVLGAAVLVAALAIRRRLRGALGTKPPDPIAVARLAVLAKTCSHVGAIVAGGYAGYLLGLVSSLEIPGRRDRAVVALLAVAAATLLLGAGLVLERVCRVRPPEDDVTPPDDVE